MDILSIIVDLAGRFPDKRASDILRNIEDEQDNFDDEIGVIEFLASRYEDEE